jgi:predicted LPLAT superfamily acyltransferase
VLPDHTKLWAAPNIGPSWRYQFVRWLIRVGGKARGYHIAYASALWYTLFYPSIRRRCRFYLNRRFPGRRGWFQRFSDTYRLVLSYAVTLVDYMVLDALGPKVISASCPDHDQLLEFCNREQGFIILHAHVGCFQIGISTLAQFPKRVSVVMIPEPQMNTFAQRATEGVIDPRSGLERVVMMTEALLRGEIVALMGDRVFGSDNNVVPVELLGGSVLFPVTPYRLASATGAKILVMTDPKVSKTSYELRVAKVIEVPKNLGRNPVDYAPYAQRFADCIEEYSGKFPWQVYNFYDPWAKP